MTQEDGALPSDQSEAGGQEAADLIAQLEAATEGSSELNAEIAALCHPTDDPQYAAFENGRDYPDLYTTSLDAALTLVPDGYTIHLCIGGGLPDCAQLRHHDMSGALDVKVEAETGPLALCIAALRARQIIVRPPDNPDAIPVYRGEMREP